MVGSTFIGHIVDKCVSKGIGYDTTYSFMNDFPLFLVALNGVHKSVSIINESPYRQGLENRLHTNRPNGKICGSFKDRNMGDDSVVRLKV